MQIETRAVTQYSEALKHEVAAAVKGGMSYQQACEKYAIKAPSTVYSWVKSHGSTKRTKKMK